MATTRRLMTADELLRLPDDGQRHELIAGELRTMAPSAGEHGWVGTNVSAPLAHYVRTHKPGLVLQAETGFLLTSDPDTVRAPDVAFIRRERALTLLHRQGYWPGAPDLAVEVLPPNDRYTEVATKVAEWLAHGASMVVVVNPRRRNVEVHRPGQAARTLTEADVLDGEDVVPGWSYPCAPSSRTASTPEARKC